MPTRAIDARAAATRVEALAWAAALEGGRAAPVQRTWRRTSAAWATALIVFAGPGHDSDLAARLRARGVAVTVVDTKVGGAEHDVRQPLVGQRLIERVRRGDYDVVFAAPPCESFSVAHRPQLRSRRWAAGPKAGRAPGGAEAGRKTTDVDNDGRHSEAATQRTARLEAGPVAIHELYLEGVYAHERQSCRAGGMGQSRSAHRCGRLAPS